MKAIIKRALEAIDDVADDEMLPEERNNEECYVEFLNELKTELENIIKES